MNIKRFDQLIDYQISLINESDIDEIIDILFESFSNIDNTKEKVKNRVYNRLLNGVSIKMEVNNEIVGVYLVVEKSIKSFLQEVKLNKIKDHINSEIFINENELSDNGIQGLALCVKKSKRGNGLGNILKKYFRKYGYDYIWGIQHKDLNNINEWLKTRELVFENENYYCTIEFIK